MEKLYKIVRKHGGKINRLNFLVVIGAVAIIYNNARVNQLMRKVYENRQPEGV